MVVDALLPAQSERLLITGANGFVGAALLRRFKAQGTQVIGAARIAPVDSELLACPALAADSDWRPLLTGCSVVVHAAARVHVMQDKAADPLAAFREVNVLGTLTLARQAAEVGVRRFIFLSSIKVNGEGTVLGRPFTAEDLPAPVDPYGISKLEAEEGLRQLAAETGMEVVIIRPPLVYGPGVKANFLTMLRWLYRGFPLPLGAIHNRRSLVALDNLTDLVVACVAHPAAANQVFLAADGEDLSTTDLLRRLAPALGKRAYLLPVPAWLLLTLATLLGKRAVAQRLCGSLQVDIAKNRSLLGWTPPMRVDAALQQTARDFLERQP